MTDEFEQACHQLEVRARTTKLIQRHLVPRPQHAPQPSNLQGGGQKEGQAFILSIRDHASCIELSWNLLQHLSSPAAQFQARLVM